MSTIPSLGDPPQEGLDQPITQEGEIEQEMDSFQAAIQKSIDAENDKFQTEVQEPMDAENEEDWENYSETAESEDDEMEIGEVDGTNILPVANEPTLKEDDSRVQPLTGSGIHVDSTSNVPDKENTQIMKSDAEINESSIVPDKGDQKSTQSDDEDSLNVPDDENQQKLVEAEVAAEKSVNVLSEPGPEIIANETTPEDDGHKPTISASDDTHGGDDAKDKPPQIDEGDDSPVQQPSVPQSQSNENMDPSTKARPEHQLKKEVVEDESLVDDGTKTVPTPHNQNPLDFVTVSFYQLKCKFCNTSFDRRKTWKKHIASEHGIQPYCCQLCGEGFDHKSDLKDHVRMHTNESSKPKSKLSIHHSTSGQSSESQMDKSKIQQPRVQLSMSEDIQERIAKAASGASVQVPPDEQKLQLTKSLKLLKVPRLRVTIDASSSKLLVKKTAADTLQSVPNKRKRGRPRRVTNTSPVKAPNKRKRSQPRKIKKAGPIKPLKIVLPSANKNARIKEELSTEEKDDKPKVDVVKGPYTLRGQGSEPDYKAQLEYKSTYQDSLGLTPFTCKYCDTGFKTKAKKLRHEKTHKDFKCTTCSTRYTSFKSLKKHEDNHYPDEMKCHFCNQVYKIKKDLWSHEESHGQICTCRWCNATLVKRSDLDTHERMHFISKGKEVHQERSVECAFCKKVCKNRKSWKSHLVSHSNIKAFECQVCHKKYKQRGSFNLHMQRHNNTFYKFTCQFCGKKYGQKALLVIHERIHTNERPFNCSHCDKAFPSKNQLDHHMERVNGVRHMCSFCGKQLNSRSSLEIHERKHTGERPIKCDHCDMDFVEPSAYKYHLRVIHTGERFECKFCGKKCKAKGVLTAHMRVHTGERPFKCKYCEKTFRSGNVLRTHLQGIHLGVRVKCEICERAFAQTSALNTHKKLVHQGLKWKDIQLQRKINREEREQRDRDLIVNAHVQPPRKDDDSHDETTSSGVLILSAIERSLIVPGMPAPTPIEDKNTTEKSSRSEIDMMGSSGRSSADRSRVDDSGIPERLVVDSARSHAERNMIEAEQQMMEVSARSIAERNMLQSSGRSADGRNMEVSSRSAAERNMMEASARSFAGRNMMETSARSIDREIIDASMRTAINRNMMEERSERMDTPARSVTEMNMMEASARSVLERGMMSAAAARHIENERNLMEAASRSAVDRRMMHGTARHIDEHERNMMAHSARPMGDPDKQNPVDVIFQPAVSGAAMYHVL